MKHMMKGKGGVMQRDTKRTNGKAIPEDNLRINGDFKKIL